MLVSTRKIIRKESPSNDHAYLRQKNYDETDTVCDFGKFKILIDDMSAEYIKGSTLDVIQEGINTTVKLINPKEINSCGCGASVQF